MRIRILIFLWPLLFLLSACGMWAQCVPAPTGLVAWWGGEGNANDNTGLNRGTFVNGVDFQPGLVGQAFHFNGAGQYVKIPRTPSLVITNQITIDFWMNSDPANPVGSAIEGLVNSDFYCVEMENTPGYVGINLVISTDNGHSYPNTADVNGGGLVFPPGEWHHVAASYDGTNMQMYLDGAAFGNPRPLSGLISPMRTNSSVSLGSEDGQTVCGYCFGTRYYKGLMDEVDIFNRALSPDEILAIYQAGSAGKCPLPPRTATAAAELAYVFVVNVNILDGGSGYTNPPAIRFLGGGGSGAQAFATISNGMVTRITVTNAGYGYTNAPLVFIDPPFIPNPALHIAPASLLSFSNLTGGSSYQLQRWTNGYWTNEPFSFTATNATSYTQLVAGAVSAGKYRLALAPVSAPAFATAQVFNGFVVGATVTSGGFGYLASPAVTILGGGGSNATAVSQIAGGVVTNINITSAGIGYTAIPAILIDPPPDGIVVAPSILPMMRLDATSLVPYDPYQLQFKPDLNTATVWANWPGAVFTTTNTTDTHYIFPTNAPAAFFRLQLLP